MIMSMASHNNDGGLIDQFTDEMSMLRIFFPQFIPDFEARWYRFPA